MDTETDTLVGTRAAGDGQARSTMADGDGPVLEVENLRTYFYTNAGVARAVDGVSFSVNAGEIVGIVGESGSGKSVTALSIMRLLETGGRIAGGHIRFQGKDVMSLSPHEMRMLRGSDIAMVFQDPMSSLNPVMRISRQVAEAMTAHGVPKEEAAKRVVSLLGKMGIVDPERASTNYPHQFSGGMRQRVVIAMGVSNHPALLLADEPTTALDVTVQAQILELFKELNRSYGTAIVLVSHDLGVIASVCSRVIVMYAGEVVEEGPTHDVLSNPRHPYTWALMNASPRMGGEIRQGRLTSIEGMPPSLLGKPPVGCRFAPRCPFREPICEQAHPDLFKMGPGHHSRCWVARNGRQFERPAQPKETPAPLVAADSRLAAKPLVSVEKLVKHFRVSGGMMHKPRIVHAIDGISLSIYPGEVVGVVGESGCGKSTLGNTILRLNEPDGGRILFDGVDITHAPRSVLQPMRRRMQMVFQNPYASLNPRMTIGETLGEPLRFHGLTTSDGQTRQKVGDLLGLVGLDADAARRYPHEFSGGQRQRVAIARALALEPDFIVADEPTSALDVNIQAQIINLMVTLREQLKLTYLFISHDLAVVRHISDRVVVLHLGQIVEVAPADELFAHPLHPYTRYLISAIPQAQAGREGRRIILDGEAASATDPPSGCRFRTRCPIAQTLCAEKTPELLERRPGHFVACHFVDSELQDG